jgi:hypothetical protein
MITTSQQAKYSRRVGGLAVLAACSLLAAACSSGDDDTQGSSPATSPESAGTTEPTVEDEPGETTDEAAPEGTTETTDEAAPDDTTDTTDATEDVPLELGRGVTDDTITLGYVYLDLDAVRERGLINLNWGPQGDHVQVIADHISANGGISGRSIEVIPLAFDPVDASSAQAACLQLTEDNEVFAVLGALRGDEVLCYTEQHDTIAVANSDMTQERLDRSNAPYASVSASRERIIDNFVSEATSAGLFDGRTVAVLSVDAVDVAAEVAIPALNDAGVSVEFESLIQGDGSVGGAAAELSVNVESMRARGVDAVVVVGDATIAANTLIGEGYFPRLFFTGQGAATAVAGRADLSAFDGVYTYGPPTPSERFADPQFQDDCAAPWDTLNPDAATQDPAVVPEGEPNHTVGLLQACRALTIFARAAEAAGPNLNNATFAAGLAGIGEFTLPGTNAASLRTGKYDAEDDLRMSTYNPDAADDESDFIEFTG